MGMGLQVLSFSLEIFYISICHNFIQHFHFYIDTYFKERCSTHNPTHSNWISQLPICFYYMFTYVCSKHFNPVESSRMSLAHVSAGAIQKAWSERSMVSSPALSQFCPLFIAPGSPSPLFCCGQLLLDLLHPDEWHFNPGIPTTLCYFLNRHLHGRWRKWPSKYILGQC